MVTDYLIAFSMLVGIFAIPAMLANYAERRFPRTSMTAFGLAMAVIVVLMVRDPVRYQLGELPNAMVRAIGGIIN